MCLPSVPLYEIAACPRAIFIHFPAENREVGAFSIIFDGGEVLQLLHVLVRDDETIDIGVGFHMRGVRRFRQRHGAELQAVADAKLCYADAIFFRHGLDGGILQDSAMADWRVGFNKDAVLLRVFDDFRRRIRDVAEHLIDDGLHRAMLQDILQVLGFEVRDAERADFSRFLIFFHRFPGGEIAFIVMIAFAEFVPWLRRMDEHQVDVVEAEARKGFFDSLLCFFIRLEVRVKLRRDVELFAAHTGTADAFADFFFISIGSRRIDEPIAEVDGIDHGLRRSFAVHQPCAEPELRDVRAVGQRIRFFQNHGYALL